MTQVQAINLTTGTIGANSSSKSKATPEEESAAAIAMFSGIMQEAQSENFFAQTENKDTSKDLFGIVDGASSKKSDAKTDYEVMNSSKPTRVEKAKEQPQEKVNERTQAVKETADKVADKVEETYGVTEEELETALETLGLTVVDLLDTSKLAALVAELTGAEDTVSLVSDATFTDLLGTVNDMVTNLLDTQGIPKTDFRQLLADINASLQSEFLAEINPEIDSQVEEGVVLGEGFEAITSEDEQIVDTTMTEPTNDGGVEITTDASTTGVTTEVVADDKNVAKDNKDSQNVAENSGERVIATTENDEVVRETASRDEETDESRDFSRPQEKRDLGALDENTAEASTDKAKTTDSSFNIFDKEPQNHAQVGGAQANTVSAQAPITETEVPIPQVAYTYEDIQNLMEQVNSAARMIATNDSHTIQMQLNPENLGRLFMSVSEKQGAVTAQIQVTNEETKAALQAQMVELKANLQAQGVKVEAVEVTVASHEFEQNLESQDTSNREMMERQAREQMEGSEGGNGNGTRNINMGDLDSISGLMTEEEQIVASMMQMNGQTLDYRA